MSGKRASIPTDEDIEIENPITRSQQYQEAIENAIQGRATRSTSGTSDEESSKKRAPKRSQKQDDPSSEEEEEDEVACIDGPSQPSTSTTVKKAAAKKPRKATPAKPKRVKKQVEPSSEEEEDDEEEEGSDEPSQPSTSAAVGKKKNADKKPRKATPAKKKQAKVAALKTAFGTSDNDEDQAGDEVTLDISNWKDIKNKAAFKRLRIKLGESWEVRVEEFLGKPRISLRKWFMEDGVERVGLGANLAIKFLPKILAAMEAASDHVKKFDLAD